MTNIVTLSTNTSAALTNMVDLQEFIGDVSQTTEGALGLGVGWTILATFIIFWFIAYIIGVIKFRTVDKTWLIPSSKYFVNIFKSWGLSIRAYAGFTLPAPQVERSDAYYYTPTTDEVDEALIIVHQMMVDGGWTIDGYQKRSKDCEDYAMKMAVELRNYIATTFEDRVGVKGVAIGNIGYTRDSDGAGHVIVNAFMSDGSVRYYEPYPGEQYLNPKVLSSMEVNSINMNIM